MSTFSKHIPLTELSDLAEKRMPASDRERLSEHLADCQSCSAKLNQLSHVFGLMRTDTEPDAPRDVVARAIDLFQSAARQSVIRRVLAILSFDSLNLAPAFGTRSGGGSSRQMVFNAEGTDIDLHITSQDNGWAISGQVFGDECQKGEVEIGGETLSYSVALNDSCEFALPVVPSGNYQLRLKWADTEVEIPRLDLRT